MLKKIVCAGFGGQGVLTAGKILLYAAYKNDLKGTWFPSYGNEMRGGAAHCNVIISDSRVASPYADHPNLLMAMNDLSLAKFEPLMEKGGDLFVNTSLVKDYKYRGDIQVYKAGVSEVAGELNSPNNANIVMLGKIAKEIDLFTIDHLEKSMCEYFEDSGKGRFNNKNVELLRAGYML